MCVHVKKAGKVEVMFFCKESDGGWWREVGGGVDNHPPPTVQ